MDPAVIEDFIIDNNIDDHAANVLRECSQDVQERVLGRGTVVAARNPSSVLLARIRDVSAAPRSSKPGLQDSPGSAYVRMRGLPFRATVDDILQFFDMFDLAADHVVFGASRDGRPSGEAFAQFANPAIADEAIAMKNNEKIDDRYIELFLANATEVQRATLNGGIGDAYPLPGNGRVATPEDVDDFLRTNPVDERAENALREIPPHLQRVVIDRGDLKSARNPSSVLLGRIRDLGPINDNRRPPPQDDGYDPRKRRRNLLDGQAEVVSSASAGDRHGGTYGHRPSNLEDEVESYIVRNGVDALAADALRALIPQVQEYILDRGNLVGLNNPSSALMSIIKEAQARFPGTSIRRLSVDPSRPVQDVENFLRSNPQLEPIAMDALRNLPHVLQQEVVARGSLANARNPSSVLLSRIREVERSAAAHGWQDNSRSVGRDAGPAPSQRDDRGELMDEVDEFLRSFDIEEHAAETLRQCSAEVQEFVLSRGLEGARNPTLALLARIRDAQANIPAGGDAREGPPDDYGTGDAGASPRHASDLDDDVEDFIAGNDLDSRAADAFRECAPDVKMSILARADLRTARNPSSALMAMMKDTQGSIPIPSGRHNGPDNAQPRSGSLPEDVEVFIVDHDLDENAAGALRESAPEIQEWVIDQGGLGGARNPSSVLLSRIRDARLQFPKASSQATGKGYYADMDLDDAIEVFIDTNKIDDMAAEALRSCVPGVKDYVLERGDMPTAKNPSSALLARIKEGRHTVPGGFGKVQSKDGAHVMDAEEFIRTFDVDERSSNALRDLPPDLQHEVIARGSLQNARNPSSVLLSRIREVQASSGVSAQDHDRRDQGDHNRDYHGRDDYGYAPPQHQGRYDHPPQPMDLSQEVEEFLAQQGVDEKAAEVFRAQLPYVQEFVLSRADVRTARNPSSALMAMIKEAKESPGKGAYTRQDSGGAPLSYGIRPRLQAEVDHFVRESEVDKRAEDALRSCTLEVQQAVVDRGPIEGARNPSALLLSRIKELQGSIPGGSATRVSPVVGYEDPRRIAEEVEDFIRANSLQGNAVDSLRGCVPRVQKAVIDRGSVTGARNPESVVLARIRDAGSSVVPMQMPVAMPMPSMFDKAARDFQWGSAGQVPGAGYVRLRGLPFTANREDIVNFFFEFRVREDEVVIAIGRDGRPSGEAFVTFPSEERARNAVQARQGHRMGERYIEMFMSTIDEVERTVPGRFSAGVAGGFGQFGGRGSAGGVGSYGSGCGGTWGGGYGGLASTGRGAGSFAPAPAHPAGVNSTASRSAVGGGGRYAEAIDTFVRANGLDENAAGALRNSDDKVKAIVLGKGGMKGARNPSAALLARIRDAAKVVTEQPRQSSSKQGSRKRRRSRSRSRRRKKGGRRRKRSSSSSSSSSPDEGRQEGGKLEEEIERFVRTHDIDATAAESLRRCEPQVQQAVMVRGIAGARNSSAALLSRIRAAKADLQR